MKHTLTLRYLLLNMLAFAFLASMPLFLPPYTVVLMISVFMYVILASSWATFCVPSNYISLATSTFFWRRSVCIRNLAVVAASSNSCDRWLF